MHEAICGTAHGVHARPAYQWTAAGVQVTVLRHLVHDMARLQLLALQHDVSEPAAALACSFDT